MGEVLAQPNFFFPLSISPTSSLVVGEVRQRRGRGREGTSGENRLTQPGRLPAAHSRHPRRAGWCDPAAWRGLCASVSPSSLPRSERAGTCSTAVVY